ncbi:DNA-3-methyladenine glycosylase [Brachybacterium sp. JB7]|uniref:DNA-3-methyladenine glycosylase n=1 Tax=Brachybacterium TaxID=43668 RepID=UPI000DF16F49|nr:MULTISPECIES: DNA-3-methyladenine glycosylase [Brachybacterium]RCS61046.1 DNA-3-methyladenine glycosylase [Brachybacterium sp. JB7]RCS91140.1 DNA-3-methyladenine glycosylase [Brachybacterium alimentarium]
MTPSDVPLPALPREFFDRPVLELAPLLLGCVLVGRGVALRITEIEAYVGAEDPGSHAYRGLTARNATMFGEPGHLYVYRHMGLHSCMNIVADAAGTGTGCLIRAGEVVGGVETALARRQAAGVCRTERDLARGPGRATVASGITFADDGLDLCDPGSGMHLTGRLDPQDRPDGEKPGEEPLLPHPQLAVGPRIGLREEASHPELFPWRYRIAGDPTVSGPGPMNR